MKKLSNPLFIKIIVLLLFLLAVAKALSVATLWFLPSNGISLNESYEYRHTYQRVDFKNMIEDKKVTKKKKTKPKQEDVQVNASGIQGISINNMILKGLYGKGKNGYAIVALKSSPKKTTIISVGDIYSGYTFIQILTDSILFTKSGKQYILEINVKDLKKPEKKTKSYIRKAPSAPEAPTAVNKKDIKHYANNPQNIMRDISIVELRSGNTIKGFKVTRIKKNSKMQDLGLKIGDVIIKANNITLKSYKDALSLYQKIDKLDTIQIVVLRNNQEKELIYDIH